MTTSLATGTVHGTPVDSAGFAYPTVSPSFDPLATFLSVSVTTPCQASASESPLTTLSSSAFANGSESVLSTKARAGAIAGGVVGGVALLVLAGIVFIFWRRKARQPRNVFSK